MRLCTVEFEGRTTVATPIDDHTLLDLDKAAKFARYETDVFTDMQRVIAEGDYGLEQAHGLIRRKHRRSMMPISKVRFLPPLMPTQFRNCLAFEKHLTNSYAATEKAGHAVGIPKVWYDQPVYYKGNRFSFIGHGADVEWPHYAKRLDIELELAIIIGKKGRDISKEDAPEYIYGYTILNDITAHDAQMLEMGGRLGPAKGKDFDTGNIIGPYILTADDVPHPAALNMEAFVNGERWGGGNSAEMHHDFADIIAHISQSETLYPGEVIGSGTVGTGCGLEIGRQLADGDRFDLTIENIGTLSNRILKP